MLSFAGGTYTIAGFCIHRFSIMNFLVAVVAGAVSAMRCTLSDSILLDE